METAFQLSVVSLGQFSLQPLEFLLAHGIGGGAVLLSHMKAIHDHLGLPQDFMGRVDVALIQQFPFWAWG